MQELVIFPYRRRKCDRSPFARNDCVRTFAAVQIKLDYGCPFYRVQHCVVRNIPSKDLVAA